MNSQYGSRISQAVKTIAPNLFTDSSVSAISTPGLNIQKQVQSLQSEKYEKELEKFRNEASEDLNLEFLQSQRSKSANSQYTSDAVNSRKWLDREIIKVKAYELKLEQLRNIWNELENESKISQDIAQNAYHGESVLDAQRKWQNEIARINNDTKSYGYIKERTEKNLKNMYKAQEVQANYADLIEKRLQSANQLTHDSNQELLVARRDLSLVKENLQDTQKKRLNKLKERVFLIEDVQFEMKNNVTQLTQKQFDQNRQQQSVESLQERLKDRELVIKSKKTEKLKNSLGAVQRDVHIFKLIEQFGKFSSDEIKQKFDAAQANNKILSLEVDATLDTVQERQKEFDQITYDFSSYRQDVIRSNTESRHRQLQKLDIYCEKETQQEITASKILQLRSNKLRDLSDIVFAVSDGLLHLLEVLRKADPCRMFGPNYKFLSTYGNEINRQNLQRLSPDDIWDLFNLLKKKLLTTQIISLTRHNWLENRNMLSQQKNKLPLSRVITHALRVAKRSNGGDQEPLGKKEFAKHFLEPKEFSSRQARASILAADMVKGYKQFDTLQQVTIKSQSTNRLSKSKSPKPPRINRRQSTNRRITITPDSVKEEIKGLETERSRIRKSTTPVPRFIRKSQTARVIKPQKVDQKWETSMRRDIQNFDRRLTKLNITAQRMKSSILPKNSLVVELKDKIRRISKFKDVTAAVTDSQSSFSMTASFNAPTRIKTGIRKSIIKQRPRTVMRRREASDFDNV